MAKEPELGLQTTRAWNDWLFEEWYSPYPERIIPLGITFLADPEEGAGEIRRNAGRGFKSVALPERPHRIGFPSLFDEYWKPIIEACAETETVISLHVGSSGVADHAPGAPSLALGATLFGQLSLTACAGMAVVGVGCPLPRVEDRHVRGWHRMGGHAPRPTGQHH